LQKPYKNQKIYADNGILLIDKPANMTSAAVVARVKKLIKAKKVGHTGTLDPFATGILICCINNATKIAGILMKGQKKYEAVLCLGMRSDTQDITGNVSLSFKKVDFSLETIKAAFDFFRGEIEQKPPAFSALKFNGKPLYKLARAGKPVQKPARSVLISSINILDIALPEIRFEVECSAGTYIRTLCADIGEHLGCGGILKELRRIESCGFGVNQAVSLKELELSALSGNFAGLIISAENALKGMDRFYAAKDLCNKIRNGAKIAKQDLDIGDLDKTEKMIKAVDEHGNLIAVFINKKNMDYLEYICVLN
jgi:tRNA pseudouridine55 synthase